jgi:hypothetical protein
MEHRWGQRFAVDIPVHLGCRPAAIGLGRIRDLSISGAYVTTALRPGLFAHVVVALSDFDTDGEPHTLAGFVVRHDADGFGIEWGQFGAAEITTLLAHFAPAQLAPLEVALDQYRRTVAGGGRR